MSLSATAATHVLTRGKEHSDMKIIRYASGGLCFLLSGCATNLSPEHSRERIFNLGLFSFVERIEARERIEAAGQGAPEIPKGPHYYQK
jgi:hypothetical protein